MTNQHRRNNAKSKDTACGTRLPVPFPPSWERNLSGRVRQPCKDRRRRAKRKRSSAKTKANTNGQAATTTPDHVDIVNQAELRKLKMFREIARESEKLRDSIRERLLAGAAVEDGAINPVMKKITVRAISFSSISNVIGEEETEDLKSRIEPVERYHLLLEE